MTDHDSSSTAKGSVLLRKKTKQPRPLSAMISPTAESHRPGSTTPCQQPQATPTGGRSALDGKQKASTPRPAARRSLSTPLGRSLSFRVSRTKDRRWSDGQTNRLSTYQEDFQSPQILSSRFQGLDLETSGHTDDPDAVSPRTTYRDSFQWRSPDRRSPRSPGEVTKASSSPLAASGNGAPVAAGTRLTRQSPAVAMPTANQPANGNGGNCAGSPEVPGRRSERQTGEQRTLASPVNQKSNPGSDLTFPATGVSSFQTGKPSGRLRRPVLSNGDVLTSAVSCDVNAAPSSTHTSTPSRLRGLQLRSSTGDNAFVYGSNSLES